MLAFKNKYPPEYTKADFELWDGNWEIIGGVPYSMAPMPSWYHQEINGNLFSELKSALKGCPRCKANLPINWEISENTIVQPDIVVVCKPFEEGLYLTKTPEIVFEILSPSTTNKDRKLKFELYRVVGVKYYIIVHPPEKTAEIFVLDSDNEYISAGIFSLELYHFEITGCEFDLKFANIW